MPTRATHEVADYDLFIKNNLPEDFQELIIDHDWIRLPDLFMIKLAYQGLTATMLFSVQKDSIGVCITKDGQSYLTKFDPNDKTLFYRIWEALRDGRNIFYIAGQLPT